MNYLKAAGLGAVFTALALLLYWGFPSLHPGQLNDIAFLVFTAVAAAACTWLGSKVRVFSARKAVVIWAALGLVLLSYWLTLTQKTEWHWYRDLWAATLLLGAVLACPGLTVSTAAFLTGVRTRALGWLLGGSVSWLLALFLFASGISVGPFFAFEHLFLAEANPLADWVRIVTSAASPAVDCTPAGAASGPSKLEKGSARLQNLTYQMEVEEWSDQGLRTGRRVMETRIPDLAVQVQGGWLVGRDEGEWGGEIVFVPTDGEPKLLEQTNVREIHSMPYGEIVVAGIAHLSMNVGFLYLVQTTEGNEVTITKLYNLPGLPRKSWVDQSGALMMKVFRRGIYMLDDKLRLRRIKCEE